MACKHSWYIQIDHKVICCNCKLVKDDAAILLNDLQSQLSHATAQREEVEGLIDAVIGGWWGEGNMLEAIDQLAAYRQKDGSDG